MPSVAKCCPNCFGDRGLGKSIIPAITSERGACSYCESQDVPLVAPLQLGDYFSVLVSIYVQADDGRQLIEWLREDWDLFHHPTMDNPRAKDLLAEVLDDGEIIRKTLVPSPKYHSDRQLRWERLRTELMHENRYFPAAQFDTERLRELLDHLQADDVPAVWHRARLQTGDAPYTIADMGLRQGASPRMVAPIRQASRTSISVQRRRLQSRKSACTPARRPASRTFRCPLASSSWTCATRAGSYPRSCSGLILPFRSGSGPSLRALLWKVVQPGPGYVEGFIGAEAFRRRSRKTPKDEAEQ
jgi:hypothetical protein